MELSALLVLFLGYGMASVSGVNEPYLSSAEFTYLFARALYAAHLTLHIIIHRSSHLMGKIPAIFVFSGYFIEALIAWLFHHHEWLSNTAVTLLAFGYLLAIYYYFFGKKDKKQ